MILSCKRLVNQCINIGGNEFRRRNPCMFFKYFCKIGLLFKAELKGDFLEAEIRDKNQSFCLCNDALHDEFGNIFAGMNNVNLAKLSS